VEIREERQRNEVADRVSALVAVTRPIIAGVLQSISAEMIEKANHTRSSVPLALLGRLRKQGDGDCGLAFEYAIHDAILTHEPICTERIADAIRHCKISRGDPRSILFAIEKAGSQQLISTESALITEESRLLSGYRGQPVKLKKHMTAIATAFRSKSAQLNLPQSIRGLWKADLILGSAVPDHWVGTTVKINPSHLEAARGLRIAIVPSRSGRSDAIYLDEGKSLVICPMPHDGSFMQVFYEGWRIVQALCETDFRAPKEVDLPNPEHREVARIYIERRDHPVGEVLRAVEKFGQPELLETQDETVDSVGFYRGNEPDTATVVSPFARMDTP
jgi:hypothetical protein